MAVELSMRRAVALKGISLKEAFRELEVRGERDVAIWHWKAVFKEDPLWALAGHLEWDELPLERWGRAGESFEDRFMGTVAENVTPNEEELVRRHLLLGLEVRRLAVLAATIRESFLELVREHQRLHHILYLPFPSPIAELPLKEVGRRGISVVAYPVLVEMTTETGGLQVVRYPCRNTGGKARPLCVVRSIEWGADLKKALIREAEALLAGKGVHRLVMVGSLPMLEELDQLGETVSKMLILPDHRYM